MSAASKYSIIDVDVKATMPRFSPPFDPSGATLLVPRAGRGRSLNGDDDQQQRRVLRPV
jgi:hypothetical protein